MKNKFITGLTGVLLLSVSSLSYSGDFLIDDFADPVSGQAATDLDVGAVGLCATANAAPGVTALDPGATFGSGCAISASGSMLGGERDIYVDLVERLPGGSASNANVTVSGGTFSFNLGSQARGTAAITYDGSNDAIKGNVVDGGLGGVDITDAGANTGFLLDVLFADAGFDFLINVWNSDLSANVSGTFTSLGTAASNTRKISFDDAQFGGFDFSSIGALQFVIDPTAGFTSLDLSLDRVSTVPEPTTVAVFGLGLLALGLGRKKRKI